MKESINFDAWPLEKRNIFAAGAFLAARKATKKVRNAVCKSLNKSWRQLQRNYKAAISPTARKARPVKATIAARRRAVKKLARTTVKHNGVKHPRYPSAQSIADALPAELRVTRWTAARDAAKVGLVSRVRRKVPTRDPRVLAERVRFAKTTLRMKVADIRRIVFSDETIKNANDYTARFMYVPKRDPKKHICGRQRSNPWNVASIQVWAAVGVGFKSPLVTFPRQERNDDGEAKGWRLNAQRYQRRCLVPLVPQLLAQKRIYQQDGARSHTAHVITKYLNSKKVELLSRWPAYSPDLNMIELVWALLQKRVAKRFARTQDELERVVREEWEAITQKEIDAICGSFAKRLRECVRRGGECVSK